MVRSSSNFAGVFTTLGSTFWTVELSNGGPCCEICGSEEGWTENRGGATQVSSKRDISLICRPIGLKFGQNLLHSWFYDLTVRIVERKSQERDAHPEQRIRVCVILTLLFFLLILHVLPRLVNLEIAVLYASS